MSDTPNLENSTATDDCEPNPDGHMYWLTPSGNYREALYVPVGSTPVTKRPSVDHCWLAGAWALDPAKLSQQKIELLVIARANREIILTRLLGHRDDAEDDLETAEEALAVAEEAEDSAGIALQQSNIAIQKNNIAAIKACRRSLKNFTKDPRVIGAVNGDVTAAVRAVYGEIIAALTAAAPSVLVAFKDLDAL